MSLIIPPISEKDIAARTARQAEYARRDALAATERARCAEPFLCRSDIEGWAGWHDSHNLMATVWDRRAELKARGLYEPALLTAFTGMHAHMVLYTARQLATFFALATPVALRLAGDPLPPGAWFTVYRGICGRRPYRRVRGFSWTLDPDTASAFAELPCGPDPAVYAAEISARHVLAYLNEGYREGEHEMIVNPRHLKNVHRIPFVSINAPLEPVKTRV